MSEPIKFHIHFTRSAGQYFLDKSARTGEGLAETIAGECCEAFTSLRASWGKSQSISVTVSQMTNPGNDDLMCDLLVSPETLALRQAFRDSHLYRSDADFLQKRIDEWLTLTGHRFMQWEDMHRSGTQVIHVGTPTPARP